MLQMKELKMYSQNNRNAFHQDLETHENKKRL